MQKLNNKVDSKRNGCVKRLNYVIWLVTRNAFNTIYSEMTIWFSAKVIFSILPINHCWSFAIVTIITTTCIACDFQLSQSTSVKLTMMFTICIWFEVCRPNLLSISRKKWKMKNKNRKLKIFFLFILVSDYQWLRWRWWTLYLVWCV